MEFLFLESEIQMPMLKLPLRSTLIKIGNKVMIISPIDFTSAQIQKITEFGVVTDLVAPSLIHHLYMKKAMSIFPNATTWATPGLKQKRKDIAWNKLLTIDPWPYQEQIEILLVEGIKRLDEVVFFCKPKKTLVTTDLCFHLLHPQGLRAQIVLRMMGTYKKFAVSKLMRKFLKDPEAFDRSLQKLFQWEFDQVVMAHGEIVTAQGKERLRAAFKDKGFTV